MNTDNLEKILLELNRELRALKNLHLSIFTSDELKSNSILYLSKNKVISKFRICDFFTNEYKQINIINDE